MQDCLKEIRNKAMTLLAQREHSRYELYSKLLFRGYDEDAVGQVVDQLSEAGLQSDDRFIDSYVKSKVQRGFGPVRIRQELHDRGIADEMIEQYLSGNIQQWDQLAIEVRIKKFGAKLPKDYKEKAKQMRFLQYRGFTSEQIKQGVLNENS